MLIHCKSTGMSFKANAINEFISYVKSSHVLSGIKTWDLRHDCNMSQQYEPFRSLGHPSVILKLIGYNFPETLLPLYKCKRNSDFKETKLSMLHVCTYCQEINKNRTSFFAALSNLKFVYLNYCIVKYDKKFFCFLSQLLVLFFLMVW